MSKPFEPVTTADLAWREGLPYSPRFRDIYFSVENGPAEVMHVFIEGNQLLERWKLFPENAAKPFVIAETGFGSGLNFLVTASLWLKHAPGSANLHYLSCEKFPFSHQDLARAIALWPQYAVVGKALLDAWPPLTPGCHVLPLDEMPITLTLMLGDAESMYGQLTGSGYPPLEQAMHGGFLDAIFLDGFAPARNETMWTPELLSSLAILSHPGTTLATFSCARIVRDALTMAGFSWKKTRGFGHKRHMIMAHRDGDMAVRQKRHTPWFSMPSGCGNPGRAIVLGAGIAGCLMANALARRGWQVRVLDAESSAGARASANPQAVLYPMLSAYSSPMSRFYLAAYPFAVRFLRRFVPAYCPGDWQGILQLANDTNILRELDAFAPFLATIPEIACRVDAARATSLAGIPLEAGGLYIPGSGWVDLQQLCACLLDSPGIDFRGGIRVDGVHRDGEFWRAGDDYGDILIIAAGAASAAFTQTAFLPLRPLRGQMTFFRETDETAALRIPVCAGGHVLPSAGGIHSVGATYYPGNASFLCSMEDDAENLSGLSAISGAIDWPGHASGHWSEVRTSTPDYLPICGAVPEMAEFLETFAGLRTNAKRWIAQSPPLHQGLYVLSGFGSRALTAAPLCSEMLAETLSSGVFLYGRDIQKSLAPSRFLYRKLVREK